MNKDDRDWSLKFEICLSCDEKDETSGLNHAVSNQVPLF